ADQAADFNAAGNAVWLFLDDDKADCAVVDKDWLAETEVINEGLIGAGKRLLRAGRVAAHEVDGRAGFKVKATAFDFMQADLGAREIHHDRHFAALLLRHGAHGIKRRAMKLVIAMGHVKPR